MQVLHCSFRTLQVLSSRTHHAPSHTLSMPGHVLLIASSMLSWTLEHSALFFARRSLHELLFMPNNQWPNDSLEKAPNLSLFVSIRRFASCKSSTTGDMVCL